jgi:hypothetical protein
MGERKNAHKLFVQKSGGKNNPEDRGAEERIILNLHLDKCGVREWIISK